MGLCAMGSTAETCARDGTPDALGIININASVATGQAAFAGRTSAAALNGRTRRSE